MMRIRGWGAVVAVAGAVLVAGCSSGGGGAAPASSVSAAASPSRAAVTVRDAAAKLQELLTAGCPQDGSNDCDRHLHDLVRAADGLRAAMHTDPAGPAFFSEAYGIVDRLDELALLYSDPLDQAGTRPQVIGLARQLARWVQAHPTS